MGDSILAVQLELVEAKLAGAARTHDPLVDDVATYLLARPGKRLRPALSLLAGDDGGTDRIIAAATAVELMHVASLHHDDVIDDSQRRRGAASANAVWGKTVSVLVGAHLFACAGRLLAPLGPDAVQLAGRAAQELQTGQARETENNYNTRLSVGEHLSILELKTASLFRLAVGLGALHHAGGGARAAILARYAGHLGLAFQLVDDVLDITGNSDVMGKNAGDDIGAGVYSLPLLLALHDVECGPALHALLSREDLDAAEHQTIRDLVADSGALDCVRALALEHARHAVRALEELPNDRATRTFAEIARFAVQRAA